jgi:hypothetical protein
MQEREIMDGDRSFTETKWVAICFVAAALALAAGPRPAIAGVGSAALLEFETTLESLDLTGGPFPLPLASDPGNLLGDSIDGYGFVNSLVTITLSSQRPLNPGPPTTGHACAFSGEEPSFAEQAAAEDGFCGGDPPPIDPDALDGELFFVDSFFDVFFDITVTDVDDRPGRDYAGQPDGASIPLLDNGPANMQSFYNVVFDKDAPNFGLIPPPEADPYIGHFLIEIPVGGDINGNGEPDKIKFTFASHAAGDENREFFTLPDGTEIDQFDSAAFLAGAVVDVSQDPPFTIGSGPGCTDPFFGCQPDPMAFGGPTTATSTLVNPLLVVPARIIKTNVVAVLTALLPTGDDKTDKRIEKAIEHLTKSLDPELWVDDSTLTEKGKKVFDEEKKAVKELRKIKDAPPEVGDAIDEIVTADRQLAQDAIDAAIAGGGDPNDIEKALREMAKAQEELDKGKPDKAIDHYKKAWEKAQKALK